MKMKKGLSAIMMVALTIGMMASTPATAKGKISSASALSLSRVGTAMKGRSSHFYGSENQHLDKGKFPRTIHFVALGVGVLAVAVIASSGNKSKSP
jgi:hypothetical protein